MPTTLYIAETDGENAITAIWIKPKGKKVARPFDPARDNPDQEEGAQFSGASEAEIKRWLWDRAKPVRNSA
jgi:hypothetical protein